jgi:tyrosyl-tRNA synthetase
MQEFSYWDRFLRIGKGEPLERVKRAITVAGRREGEKISAAQLFYPVMQVTDIFQMNIDICQLGIDQRRANMLAREAAKRYKWHMPIAVHHPLMLGLHGIPKGTAIKDESFLIEYKMSKSQPSTCIYMHDSYDQLTKKINGAYCPERLLEGNPMINYLDTLLIDDKNSQIMIDRPQKFGGPLEFGNYQELLDTYSKGALHPTDLKKFVIEEFEKRIKPVREYFETHKTAKELYEQVKSYGITR